MLITIEETISQTFNVEGNNIKNEDIIKFYKSGNLIFDDPKLLHSKIINNDTKETIYDE